MKAGRELDALVADKVMGLTVTPLPTALSRTTPHVQMDPKDGSGYEPCPRYSTNIAAAWEVVAHMMEHAPVRYRNLSLVVYCYNRTYATFDAEAIGDYDRDKWCEANGEHHTPLAICLAALKAVER